MSILKKLPLLLIFALLTACGNDDDEITQLTVSGLTDPDTGTLTVPAAPDQSPSLMVEAPEAWFAQIIDSDGSPTDDIGWLSFVNARGSGGHEQPLSFNVEVNKTALARSARVEIISVGLVQKVITVTQLPADPDYILDPYEMRITTTRYYSNGTVEEEDGVTTMSILFNTDGRPKQYTQSWRDEEDGGYSETVETGIFTFSASDVTARITQVETHYPSGNKETETSDHHATLNADGRIDAGWFRDDDDPRVDYTIAYDESGHADQTTYDSSSRAPLPIVFNWVGNTLSSVQVIRNGNLYGHVLIDENSSLANPFECLDINWITPTEISLLDKAAGDPTRIFAVFNLTGMRNPCVATRFHPVATDDEGEGCRIEVLEPVGYERYRLKVTEENNGLDGNYRIISIETGTEVR